MVLNALEGVANVNVLSSPQMMVLNNQTATLQVGDQVPIATQQATSVLVPGAPVVNTIQFRDTGVILEVTPRMNESGQTQMDFNQEVCDVARATTSGIDSPTMQQRKFNSTISVRSGESIALGGLVRERRVTGDSGVPLVKDIPVLKNLFKTATGNHMMDSELTAKFCTEYTRQMNLLRMEHTAQLGSYRSELERATRQTAKLVDAIKNGVSASRSKIRLAVLKAAKPSSGICWRTRTKRRHCCNPQWPNIIARRCATWW